jgi:hypothetical protein
VTLSTSEPGEQPNKKTRRTSQLPRSGNLEIEMTFLKKLLGRNKPVERIRVCRQCGMPVAEHKEWCTIYKAEQAMQPARVDAAGASD